MQLMWLRHMVNVIRSQTQGISDMQLMWLQHSSDVCCQVNDLHITINFTNSLNSKLPNKKTAMNVNQAITQVESKTSVLLTNHQHLASLFLKLRKQKCPHVQKATKKDNPPKYLVVFNYNNGGRCTCIMYEHLCILGDENCRKAFYLLGYNAYKKGTAIMTASDFVI